MNTQFGAVILSTLAVVVVDQQDSSFIAWERFYARSVFVREGERKREHRIILGDKKNCAVSFR